MTADLALIALLVLVNAAFAGTEIAVVSLRRSQLLRLAAEHGRRGQMLLTLADEPTRFLSTIQVGITLAGFLASAAAAVSLAEPLEPYLEFLGRAAAPVALILVTLALTFVTLVFGELVPKRVAMRQPERWALRAAPPVTMVARVARPVIWLLSRSTDLVARLVGGGSGDEARPLMSDDEVMDVLAAESTITPARRALVEGVLDLAERTVREVLTPRRDVFVLDATLTCAQASRELATNGYSRAPVCEDGQLDNVLGITLLAVLVAHDSPDDPVTACIDPNPIIVPEAARIQDVLGLLQQRRRQLALIADEHGSTVGIVTLEDLLEEIVGELYDELDRDLSSDDPRGYTGNADGSFDLPGTFPTHDLPDLGMPRPEEMEAATVGGLLLEALERLPGPGDHVTITGLRVEALAVSGLVIERVRVARV